MIDARQLCVRERQHIVSGLLPAPKVAVRNSKLVVRY